MLIFNLQKAQQTVNHLISDCPDIGQQRLKQINQIIQNGDQWPVTNQQLVSRHLRNFCEFVKSVILKNNGKEQEWGVKTVNMT